MGQADALKTHCLRNHELSGDNIRTWAGAPTRRQCKECEKHNRLAREYGLSMDDFQAMLAKQDGKCAICSVVLVMRLSGPKMNSSAAVCVDHNHETGVVRGLLCNHCNRVLGMMQDDPARLMAAASYLIEHEGAEA